MQILGAFSLFVSLAVFIGLLHHKISIKTNGSSGRGEGIVEVPMPICVERRQAGALMATSRRNSSRCKEL